MRFFLLIQEGISVVILCVSHRNLAFLIIFILVNNQTDVALIIDNGKTASKCHIEHKAVLVSPPQLRMWQGISGSFPNRKRASQGTEEKRQECNFASSVKIEQPSGCSRMRKQGVMIHHQSLPKLLFPLSSATQNSWVKDKILIFLGIKQEDIWGGNASVFSTEWLGELLVFQNKYTGHVYNTDCYKQHPLLSPGLKKDYADGKVGR